MKNTKDGSAGYASEMLADLERNSKRWFIIAMVELFVILASVGMFVYYNLQYDYVGESVYEEYVQDGSGYNNINTGEQGDINNGTAVQEDYQNK